MICRRDVSMQSRGAREFARHYGADRHLSRGVAYRVQHNMPVYDQLMKPLELTPEQRDGYLNQETVEKDEGFSFPEDLLPTCTRIDSTVPLLTMVNCVAELCRWGGSCVLLRKLWGNFRATLGPDIPLYNLHWNRPETLVSSLYRDGVLCTLLFRHFWLFVGVSIRKVCILVADLPCLISPSASVCLFADYYLRLLQCVFRGASGWAVLFCAHVGR